MRKSLYVIAAAAITAVTFTASVKPSEAQIIYPWCANYGGRHMGGAPNCGFVTYAQCMATIQGLGGWCGQNPWYEPTPSPRRVRRAN